MKHQLFAPSYPDVVAQANWLWTGGAFKAASRCYLRAARLAPTDEFETVMMQLAWCARERSAGRISKLEAGD